MEIQISKLNELKAFSLPRIQRMGFFELVAVEQICEDIKRHSSSPQIVVQFLKLATEKAKAHNAVSEVFIQEAKRRTSCAVMISSLSSKPSLTATTETNGINIAWQDPVKAYAQYVDCNNSSIAMEHGDYCGCSKRRFRDEWTIEEDFEDEVEILESICSRTPSSPPLSPMSREEQLPANRTLAETIFSLPHFMHGPHECLNECRPDGTLSRVLDFSKPCPKDVTACDTLRVLLELCDRLAFRKSEFEMYFERLVMFAREVLHNQSSELSKPEWRQLSSLFRDDICYFMKPSHESFPTLLLDNSEPAKLISPLFEASACIHDWYCTLLIELMGAIERTIAKLPSIMEYPHRNVISPLPAPESIDYEGSPPKQKGLLPRRPRPTRVSRSMKY